MDINEIVTFFKKLLLMIFTQFGVVEEFDALGIDIEAMLLGEETTVAQ